MKRLPLVLLATAGLLAPAVALAATVDRTAFRYERTLAATGDGPMTIEPDGQLFAHSQPGFADVRILDADGEQVPWRALPEPEEPVLRPVRVLDSGRIGQTTSALLDLGPRPHVVDQAELALVGAHFVGHVTVLGSDDRRRFTRLSTTTVYDLGGARPTRSTVVVFPPSDFRYLLVRGRGVPRVTGASVAADGKPTPLQPVRARVRVRQSATATVVTLDLGHANVPVDELRIRATTPTYDRAIEAAGVPGRIVRNPDLVVDRVELEAASRSIQVRIENGDDPPLQGLRVTALARPRTLLVQGGHDGPLTVLYGAPMGPPTYDYALVPTGDLKLDAAFSGALGPERRNASFATRDTRSFVARHRALLDATLALAAAIVLLGAALAIRRR